MEETKNTKEWITIDTEIPPLPEKNERLPAPDEEKYESEMKVMEEKISKLKLQKNNVSQQINELKNGGGIENKSISTKQYITEKIHMCKELNLEKTNNQKKLENFKSDFRRLCEEQKRLKPKIKYYEEEDINKRIESLQYKLETTTVTLQEEKQIVAELTQLQQAKPLLAQFKAGSLKLDHNKKKQQELKDRINVIYNEVRAISKEIEDINQNLKSSQEKSRETIPNLIEEKKLISDQINVIETDKKRLFENFKKTKNDYVKQQKLIKYIEWAGKLKNRLIEDEKRKKEKEALEQLKQLNKPHPYQKEINLCETFINYLTNILPKPPSQLEETKEIPQDNTYLSNKDERRELENQEWFKQKKKQKKKRDKNKEDKLHSLPIELLNFFSYTSIKVPTKQEDIEPAIEDLKAQKEKFKALTVRDEKIETEAKGIFKQKILPSMEEFPAPENSKIIVNYGIFQDEGPTIKEDHKQSAK
ncbi:unnamed protein product [Blepharisma stoltei]|uniref:Uncharacterized protein n=1 Tax=Blepharisma stoltei TaxID=1481888 RepID=A0AAU9JWC1_9CILI|nr:unnamed protein product [Blepharisma stoltei]